LLFSVDYEKNEIIKIPFERATQEWKIPFDLTATQTRINIEEYGHIGRD
jgi:hypothetical protein